MTILSELQKLKTEQKIAQEKREFNVKKQQYDNLQRQNKTQSARIPDITLNRDYLRFTSSAVNV